MKDLLGKKIVFLTPYPPGQAPSQRFRFEQYLGLIGESGGSFQMFSFLSSWGWKVVYKKEAVLSKALALVLGFGRRALQLFRIPKADFVFVHRELTPIGPPIFEWIIARVLRKKIIYDFDDAIWITDDESRLINRIKFFGKVPKIIRWSYKVSCGNDYLRNFALGHNPQSFLIPTSIDLENHHNKTKPPQGNSNYRMDRNPFYPSLLRNPDSRN